MQLKNVQPKENFVAILRNHNFGLNTNSKFCHEQVMIKLLWQIYLTQPEFSAFVSKTIYIRIPVAIKINFAAFSSLKNLQNIVWHADLILTKVINYFIRHQ